MRFKRGGGAWYSETNSIYLTGPSLAAAAISLTGFRLRRAAAAGIRALHALRGKSRAGGLGYGLSPEGKNRIARNAERDKRIERLYYANRSGSPMDALDICRVLQAGNRAIALNPEITDAELATVIVDFVQTIRMN
jgi:hypothetical protein